jgi:Cu/Ag efflux protein CusF
MTSRLKTVMLTLAVVSLPSAALSAALAEKITVLANTPGVLITDQPSMESMHGIVDGVDQGNDTIKIRLSPDKIEQFRVQDGLVFDSIRFGDEVEITVENITGAKTIVELRRE